MQEVTVVAKDVTKVAEFSGVHFYGHACEDGGFVIIGAGTILGDDVTQDVDARGFKPGTKRRALQLMKAQIRDEGRKCRYMINRGVVRCRDRPWRVAQQRRNPPHVITDLV